ncbi:hypothetical protein A2635_00250 [Candidatus Peribacteria bacterium RIFCSPHIGHO2_01_FULL_51_9]|nr:MAG: hypothetical protein A2635_00250 [Candidatus Peribacteria bacterium RIFCSPHIGHO2_01_FULL_51_9]
MLLSSFKGPNARRHIIIGIVSIVTALALLPNIPTSSWQAALRSPFTDTDPHTLHGHAILRLFDRGIVSGFPDKTFRGHLPVSRAEAAKMLLRAANIPLDENLQSPFSDVFGNEWFSAYVLTAEQHKIIQGYSDGSFRPQRSISTAEFLKMATMTFGLPESLPHHFADVRDNDWFARFAGMAWHYHLFPERIDHRTLTPDLRVMRSDFALALSQILNFGSRAHFNKPEWKWIPPRGSSLLTLPKPVTNVSPLPSLEESPISADEP